MSSWSTSLRQLRRRARLVYGINRRNVELVYALNSRADYPLADDKLHTKRVLSAAGVPVADTLAVCHGLGEIPATLAQLREQEHFVIKPAQGAGGRGLLVVGERRGTDTWRRPGGERIDLIGLHRHLANIVFGAYSRGALEDRVLVERRIVGHPYFAELWRDGLCDVRVVTCRGRARVAMVRIPTAASAGRANLHQGGIGLAIDLASGRVRRGWHRGHLIRCHPDSGRVLVGGVLPLWQETLRTAEEAASAVPLGFLGVDIVVDADRGPLVLELNVRPGLEIQNVTGTPLGQVLQEEAWMR